MANSAQPQNNHGHSEPSGYHNPENHDHEAPIQKTDVVRIVLVGFAIPLVWWLLDTQRPLGLAFGIGTTCLGGWPILREALENAWARRMTMELSMTIALIAALIVGEYPRTSPLASHQPDSRIAPPQLESGSDRFRRLIHDSILSTLPTLARTLFRLLFLWSSIRSS